MKVVVNRLLALVLAIAMLTAGTVMGVAEGEMPADPNLPSNASSLEPTAPAAAPKVTKTYTFARFARGGSDGQSAPNPLGLSTITFDCTKESGDSTINARAYELAIYELKQDDNTGINKISGDLKNKLTVSDTSFFDLKLINSPNKTPDDGDVIKIIPKANGSATLSYDNTTSITITISNHTAPANTIWDITNPQPVALAANAARTIEYDGVEPKTKEFNLLLAASDNVNVGVSLADYTLNGNVMSTFSGGRNYNNEINIKYDSAREVLRIMALKNTSAPIAITLAKGSESHTVKVVVTGFPTDDYIRVFDGTVAESSSHVLSSAVLGLETSSTPYLLEFHFGHYVTDDAPVTRIAAGTGATFTLKTNEGNVFSIDTSPQGNQRIVVNRSTAGLFSLVFEVSYNGNQYTTEPFVVNIVKRPDPVVVEVPSDEYPTIRAALDAFKAKPEVELLQKDHIIKLKSGEYWESGSTGTIAEIDYDVPHITIRGAEDGTTVLLAKIKVNLTDANKRNYLENLTLAGSTNGDRVAGTGITDAQGKIAGDKVTVKNFEVGIDMVHTVLPVVSAVENCGVGMKHFVYPMGGSLSIGRFASFKDNDTALQIKDGGNSNPFAFAIYYSNFEGNKTNVENLNTSVKYNLSFNYYDEVTAENYSTKFKNVDASPYFKDKVNLEGKTVPSKLYISPGELAGGVNIPADRMGTNDKLDTSNFGAAGTGKIKLMEVASTGAGSEVAAWQFPAQTGSGSFNPSIKPELLPTSNAALGALEEGAKYQPVSFAHSGALPGKATVDLVQTTADAATTGMKLYKVVGNRLVLQEDTVTFAGGKYTFTRDSASDYIITDSTVANPPSDSSGGGSGGGGGGGSITADDVADKFDKVPAGGSVSLSVAGSPNVSIGVFDKLKQNQSATLVLKGDGFTWSFAGRDIGSTAGLATFNAAISRTSPNATAVSRIAGTTNLVNVYFAYHGKLPGKATVELAVPAKYRDTLLNFYYINTTTGKPELVTKGLKSFNDKLKVSITHCSDYILTPDTIAGAVTMTGTFTNPETGGYSLQLYNKLMRLYQSEWQ